MRSITAPENTTPTVTVAIPVYNGERFLAGAMESVLHQDFGDLELVVVDDGSTDGSLDVATSFKDERVRVLQNSERLGLPGNWNRCIEVTGGEYICILHQDDVMMPGNLRQKADALSRYAEAGFAYSQTVCIDEGGNRLPDQPWAGAPEAEGVVVEQGRRFFERLLLATTNPICCPSVLARRTCYEQWGAFDTRLPFTVDWEMWMRLSLRCDVAYLPAVLMAYRLHSGNETRRYSDLQVHKEGLRAKRLALDKNRSLLPEHDRLLREVRNKYGWLGLNCAREHLERGNRRRAWGFLGFALSVDPAMIMEKDTAWVAAKLLTPLHTNNAGE